MIHITFEQYFWLGIVAVSAGLTIWTSLHRAATAKEISEAKQEVLKLLGEAKALLRSEEQKISAAARAELDRIYGEASSAAVSELVTLKGDFYKALKASRLRLENVIEGVEIKGRSIVKNAANEIASVVEQKQKTAVTSQSAPQPPTGLGATAS